jgi:two-component system, NarL family, sensor histidine kinase EvgS
MQQLTNKRALVVDDEKSMRELLALLLESLGVTVLTAESGAQALQLYRCETFDVVFTDKNMPQIRGDELAQVIKAINPAQRVIMITGSGGNVLQHGSLPPVIDGLIFKPCHLHELIDALNGTPLHKHEAPRLTKIAA